MNLVTKDILYNILLYVDNLTNIIVNKHTNELSNNVYMDKLFWVHKLNYHDFYSILRANGNWICDYYFKYNIPVPFQYQQVSKLRHCQYVIMNGKPCKIIAITTTKD